MKTTRTMEEMIERLTSQAGTRNHKDGVGNTRTGYYKHKLKPGSTCAEIAYKRLFFPFNPFDLNDITYNDQNLFAVVMAPSEFRTLIGRNLYHNSPAYKERIDKRWANIPEKHKKAIGAGKLEAPVIPVESDAPISQTELMVYGSFCKFHIEEGIFRTSRLGKFDKVFLDTTVYEMSEDGYLVPLTETAAYSIGQIEERIAAYNEKIAKDEVKHLESMKDTTQEEKDEYVSSRSYRASLISRPMRKAILPIQQFLIDHSTGDEFENKEFDTKSYDSFVGCTRYIQDKELIDLLEQKLGTPEDRNEDFFLYYVTVTVPASIKDLTNLSLADYAAIYAAKSITTKSDFPLETFYDGLHEHVAKFASIQYFDEQREELGLDDEAETSAIKSVFSDHFKKNAQCFRTISDSALISQFTSKRSTEDINMKIGLKDLENLSAAFNLIGLDVEELMAASSMAQKIVDIDGLDIELGDGTMPVKGTQVLIETASDVVASEFGGGDEEVC